MQLSTSNKRIGINLLYLYSNRNGGAGTYIRNVWEEMRQRAGIDWVLFVNQNQHRCYETATNVTVVKCPVSGRQQITRVLYEQVWLMRKARQQGCDVLFCPGYLAPVRGSVPVVMSILDTQFIDIPQLIDAKQRWVYRIIIPRAARRAMAIITISEFSRKQIIRHLGISADRVHVTYLASKPMVQHIDNAAAILGEYGLIKPYLLSVSSGSPHKNVARLCMAFIKARPEIGKEVMLALAGNRQPRMLDESSEQKNNIRSIGFVKEEHLGTVYQEACGFVLASLYEGFGLPVLEAMSAGVPVACSRAASLPEVAGKAALLFEPENEESIRQALVRLVTDAPLRMRLVEDGMRNLERFSWKRCADQTASVLMAAAECSGAS